MIGVVKVLVKVFLYLNGKFYGMVFCVLILNVFFVDLVVDVKCDVIVEVINDVFKIVVNGVLKGIVEFSEEFLVFIDFNINIYLVIIDGLFIMVMGDCKVKVFVWYDNEWGYFCRVVDFVMLVVEELVK